MTKRIYQTPRYWLTLVDCENIFKAFKRQIEFEEPIPSFETRFPGKLESILGSVEATYDGKNLNPTILDAAAAYFNQLVRGHPFKNGNKRLAVLFTHIFLIANGINYDLKQKEMYVFAIIIAGAGEEGLPSDMTKDICRAILDKYTSDFDLI